MLNRLLKYKFHVVPLINPLIWDDIGRMGEYCGINHSTNRENKIIVSLTSYQERFKNLPIALYSLLNQSIKPDKLILWLNKEYDDMTTLPYNITKLINNGLEIRFVKDIKSYTKVIHALKEFSDSIVVTADDDIYYRKDWLKNLYMSYVANPEDIHVHRAHRVLLEDDKILPYENWKKHVNEESARFDNFLTGVGGVLYPPKCFINEVFREDIFLKNAPTADDLWLWVMALLSNRKIRVVQNHYCTIILTDILSHFTKDNLYILNKKGDNDKQLSALMKLYGQNIINKLRKNN